MCVYIYKLNGGSKPIKITVGPHMAHMGSPRKTIFFLISSPATGFSTTYSNSASKPGILR